VTGSVRRAVAPAAVVLLAAAALAAGSTGTATGRALPATNVPSGAFSATNGAFVAREAAGAEQPGGLAPGSLAPGSLAPGSLAPGSPAPGGLAPGVPRAGTLIGASALPAGLLPPGPSAAGGRVAAFVELAEAPAVDAFHTGLRRSRAAAAASARAARARVDGHAERVLADLRGRDATARELYRTTDAVAGVAVLAEGASLRGLAANPDVRSVRRIVPKKVDNAGAAVLTRVLRAWQSTGRFGDDVRVGVIDTGIDYTHADFGGPGTPEAYEAIDETVADPSYFPTAKVAGGHDFAGNAYDGASTDPALRTPAPDPNPLDCNGHGSHVAGTAAGLGVNADGSTFTGDYAALSAGELDGMRIGPGMAPRAVLYALKVFGCAGSTSLTASALDWALDPDRDGDFTDHLDVVNLSLGADYGAPDDPENLFVRKLNQNGVLTVFSAGNGGDLYDVGGSPGNTPEALTVASTRDAFVLRDAAEVTLPAEVAGAKAGQYSVEFTGYDGLDLDRPVVPLSSATNLDGCQPFSPADAAAVAGRFAWLEWDDDDATRRCGSATRTTNAQDAGAAGVVLSSTLENFAAAIAGNAGTPVFQLTGSGTAQLRPALAAGTLSLRMAGELRSSLKTFLSAIEDTPSAFTSRGTRTDIKPDVAAPGDTIASVRVGSGNLPQVGSGTSMAAPHVAGIAALVRQAHPDWTTAEVKAAVMNTANHDVHANDGGGGPVLAPNRTGAGRVDAKDALDNQVLAFVEDGPGKVSVGFGVVEAAGPVSLTKTIRVVNKSTRQLRYDVAYRAVTDLPGAEYQLDRASITLTPRGIARIRVTLRVDDPSELRKVADPTIEKEQFGAPRQFLADESGRVELTPAAGNPGGLVPLRVAVYAAPKPVAAIGTPFQVRAWDGEQAVLNLSGRGLRQGSGDQRYLSLLSALQLQATSPRLPDCGQRASAGCAINGTARGGDLRYIGAASTAPLARLRGEPETAMLGFGIATWGDWYNLGSNTVPFVDLDTDGDAVPDFEIFAIKPAGTDLLLAVTVDLPSGDLVAIEGVNGLFGDVDANVFDTNVVVLPVRLADLGIDPNGASARLSYRVGVAGFYAASGGLVDLVPGPMSFDPLRPGLWVQGGGEPALSYVAAPGTALVVNRDAEALELDGTDSLLVLNHHNAQGDRASLVRVLGPIGPIGPGRPG